MFGLNQQGYIVGPSVQRELPSTRTASSLVQRLPHKKQVSVHACAAGRVNLFRSYGSIEDAISRLRGIRGVGEWTASDVSLLRSCEARRQSV